MSATGSGDQSNSRDSSKMAHRSAKPNPITSISDRARPRLALTLLRMPGGKRCVAATIVNVRRSALRRGQFRVSVQMDDGGISVLETAEWGTRWGFDRRKTPRFE